MTSKEFEAAGQTMMTQLLAVYLAAPDEQKKKTFAYTTNDGAFERYV